MRKPVDGQATAFMMALCLAWGMQQVAIKAVAGDVPPLLQVVLRSGVGALLVWLVGHLVLRERWLRGVGLRSGLVVGALFAGEFLFVAEGLRWTSASHMAVFLYTGPMFAAVGLHLRLPEERLSRLQWTGIGMAFIGILVTFLAPEKSDPAGADTNWLLGDLMGLCAGLGWGLTTVAVRTSRLSEAPATQTLFYQLAGAAVLLLPVMLVSGQTQFHSTPLVWASLGFQALLVSFASYLTWFWLLRHYLAAPLGVLSFMTPLIGVVLGVILLGEQLTYGFLVGATLVLAGLLVVNARSWLPLLRKISVKQTPMA
ncbi:DMT family transporter [Castellaniella sp.]|uniref:DMT family transporter n=1 Tax=Castellaniella sp. TaxID=1955812 RepID=UPI003565B47B